ncbi:MAG: ubiquinone biosynthesis regulatory protein kinase UbiB [Gammaproteobacteria bacterium]|nr:ubiquinone biosynthesis regulatory protein kinase UbiB [Gammaproteobacteria bacterium]
MRGRYLSRLWQIFRVLTRHGLHEFAYKLHLLGPLRWLARLIPHNKRHTRDNLAQRLRLALEDLGPIFVKFGQALSTRPDLLPDDIASELAKLQDQVPPFGGEQARQILEQIYRQPLTEVFAEFSETPLASASIAQVHPARLKSGEQVVVKVLPPGVDRNIRRDVEVLKALARLAERYWRETRRFHPVDVVDEYEKTVLDELDLMREAANAAQLKRNFPDSPLLYVPEVYWDYCRVDALVIERLYGIPISDIDELRARDVDMKLLAERGVETFFTQVFEHNFFHADMHPGNIFVDASDPASPKYKAVDFGIVGTLTPFDQHYLASNLLAFFNRDYRKVAELHVESGWVPAGTRVDEFEAAIRTVCEPIFNKPLKDISFGHFLVRLFQTARRFDMEVQPQLTLLQKTLLNIEGLGRQLYPDLDLWQTAKPFLEKWMRQRSSPMSLFKRLCRQWPQWRSWLEQGPSGIDASGQCLAGERHAGHDVRNSSVSGSIDSSQQGQQYVKLNQSIASAIVGGSLLVSATLLHVFEAANAGWIVTTALFGIGFCWRGLRHADRA